MEKESLGRVVFLHGIKTPRKNRKIHRLARAFRREGFYAVIPYYGYIPAAIAGLFGWLDRRLADFLASFIQDDDILVGYSNGATLVYMISQRVSIRGAILINAALEPTLAPRAGFVHVYFNEGDWATWLAGKVPFHLWGNMGQVGYKGNRKDVVNVDEGNPPLGLPPLNGHTDLFNDTNLRPWACFIAARCVEEIASPKPIQTIASTSPASQEEASSPESSVPSASASSAYGPQ